jgi:biotin transport system substrate-specific component
MDNTLAARLWPVEATNGTLRALALVCVGSLVLTLSAKTQVPFWPVPMTMQTFVVLVLGAAYGARLAGATVLFYLAQGAIGLPVFATGAGLAYMAGPTGGYLMGFLVAAVVVGALAERGWDRRITTAALAFLIGDLIILLLGFSWLATLIGAERAMAAGVLPFLPAEALKIALAVALLPIAWRLVRRD